MKTESLLDVIHAQPFRPFALMLADGTRIPVPHPEFIMLPSTARTAVVMDSNDRIRVLDVALLLGVEDIVPEEVAAEGD